MLCIELNLVVALLIPSILHFLCMIYLAHNLLLQFIANSLYVYVYVDCLTFTVKFIVMHIYDLILYLRC